MANASAWGIDLGNRALKAIKLVREGDTFRITDFEIIEHEQVLSAAGDNRESLQRTALATFVERHQTRSSVVGVSVSGQSSFARFIKLPPVEPKKIPEIVKFEAIQQIPFPLDDVEWSYQLFQEKDSPDVEVGIFAMRKDLVNRHIAFFTNLGLNVQVVQMNPLAVYNGMYHDDQIPKTTIFMDSGADNTDLIIADRQTVWLRTLPIGGNNFTESLAKNFKLSFAKAEELKRNAATSKYAKQIFQAMRPVFADLVAEIQRSIGFYASVHREAQIRRIVAMGSTFQLPGLQKYLQQNLQLPVEKLDAYKALPPIDAKMAANFAENVATLSGAYGLALQAMGESKISSSLLPESIRRAKMWQEKTKWFATAAATFLVGAIGVIASYSYHTYAYERGQSARSDNETVLRQASGLSSKWKQQVQDVGEEDRQKVLQLRAIQDYQAMWLDFVSSVLTTLPNKSLAQLRATPRDKRELITIHSIQSEYWPDLTEPLAPSAAFASFVNKEGVGTGAMGVGGLRQPAGIRPDMARWTGAVPPPRDAFGAGALDAAAEPQPGPRGFLVTIRGTTPRPGKAGSDYVVKVLVERLTAMKPDVQISLGKSYYIAKADFAGGGGPRVVNRPPNAGGVFERGARSGAADSVPDLVDADILGGTATAVGNMQGNRQTRVDPATGKPLVDPLQDPGFPGETIENDSVFTVLAALALDPAPTPKTEGQ